MRVLVVVGVVVLLVSSVGLLPNVFADAPSVSIGSPSEGAVLAGVVSVSGVADSEVGISGVQVRVDNGPGMNAELVATEASWLWEIAVDTALFTNGAHTISAYARDVGGIGAEVSINVVFDNPIVYELNVVSMEQTNAVPVVGGSVVELSIEAVVANEGSDEIAGAAARAFFETRDGWQLLGPDLMFDVPAEGTTTIAWQWNSVTKFGAFDMRLVLDPDNLILEADETNNDAVTSVVWGTDAGLTMDLLYPTSPDPVTWRVKEVQIVGSGSDSAYVGPVTFVRQGDYLFWMNQDQTGEIHTATARDGSFDTGWIEPVWYSDPVFFELPGVYDYYCTVHDNMQGTVVVLS